jgi:hypothetical protein
MYSRHPVRSALVVLALVALTASSVLAQGAGKPAGTIEGTVSTQGGTVMLPGVVITIRTATGQDSAQVVSDENGHFSAPALPPTRYRVSASLDGFDTLEKDAVVNDGAVVSLMIDLAISEHSEVVDVVAPAPIFEATTLATAEAVGGSEAQLLVPGQGVQSAMKLMSGVIAIPGGNSIDGGRPYQAGMQMGPATLIDPSTNTSPLQLPASAIDSVSVLPNPYEVEFGRFSSGLVVVQTKHPRDKWKWFVDNFQPALRLKRFTLFQVTGITLFQPTIAVGGPIIRNRLWVEQFAQYRYQTTDIPSRPETELKTTQLFSSLTRVDAKLSPQHSLLITGGAVPSVTTQATLGTFVPPDATVDLHDHATHVTVAERAVLGKETALESTVGYYRHHIDVEGQGDTPMTLLPETTLGNFYNTQHRATSAFQWTETASRSYSGVGGVHLLKAGVDLLTSSYDGTSASTAIDIERSDGTLARRLDFDPLTTQSVQSTDVALFAQDRFQATPWMSVVFGGRLDRDGITERSYASPRAGVVFRVNKSGSATLHGGYGLFYERTPSVAGAFDQFARLTDTRFEADGVTPSGPSVPYVNVRAPGLQSARSATWDVAFDDQIFRSLSLHMGVLDRQGNHQLIVEPVLTDEGGQYELTSSGRSSYVQEEVEAHFAKGSRADVNASFVHSQAREDLNSLLDFVDAVLQPVISTNAYAPAAADVPNRLLLRGRVAVTNGWQFLATGDWRSGLPYSVVNENLDFVGARNMLRFPRYFRMDTGLERRLTVLGLHPWVGIHVANALNSFLPSDVQANLGSPAFGSFYNSVYREWRIVVRFYQ